MLADDVAAAIVALRFECDAPQFARVDRVVEQHVHVLAAGHEVDLALVLPVVERQQRQQAPALSNFE